MDIKYDSFYTLSYNFSYKNQEPEASIRLKV